MNYLSDMKKIKAMFQVHGSGNMTTQERTVSSFIKLHLHFHGKATIVQSDEEKVVVECDDNLQEHVGTMNSGRTLYVVEESGIKKPLFTKLHVTIYVRNIDTLRNSMAGEVETQGPIRSTSPFELVVDALGESRIELDVPALKCLLRCNGDTHLSGKSGTTLIKNQANGNLFARELNAASLTLKNMANGNVEVRAEEQIIIKHMGNGYVHYYGPAVLKDVNMMGTDNVRHMKD